MTRRYTATDDRRDYPRLVVGRKYRMRRGSGWLEVLAVGPNPSGQGCYYTVRSNACETWSQNDFAILNQVRVIPGIETADQLSLLV